jgi:hypothetical protein
LVKALEGSEEAGKGEKPGLREGVGIKIFVTKGVI